MIKTVAIAGTILVLIVWSITDFKTRTINPYLSLIPILSGVAAWMYTAPGMSGAQILSAVTYTALIIAALIIGGAKKGDWLMMISVAIGVGWLSWPVTGLALPTIALIAAALTLPLAGLVLVRDGLDAYDPHIDYDNPVVDALSNIRTVYAPQLCLATVAVTIMSIAT